MKLSDIKGEKALDMVADLIEPISEIMADEKVKKIYSGQPKLKLAQYIIKNHKKSIIEILAILNEEKPEEYVKKITLTTLPIIIIDLLNDEELLNLFSSQSQITEETSSGSAMGNTGAKKK